MLPARPELSYGPCLRLCTLRGALNYPRSMLALLKASESWEAQLVARMDIARVAPAAQQRDVSANCNSSLE